MKTCGVCRESKLFSDFNRRGAGYQSKCRECQRSWYKEYYDSSEREKQRLLESNEVARDELRKIIREAKDVPCTDCKQRYPYYVMDFDHVDDNKSFNVGGAVWENKPKAKVIEEITKCEVVCSNCHRIRTHARR